MTNEYREDDPDEYTDISEDCLYELVKYHMPCVSIEDLQKEPYLLYTKMYCEMSNGLNFFQGYFRPSIIEKAKIYRAINLCSKNKKNNNFIVFTTGEGLIIKYRGNPPTMEFEKYLEQSNSYVFIPNKCDRLNIYDYAYYRRLLSDFCVREHIQGELIANLEQDNQFLFISLEQPSNSIERKWDEYISGGVNREFTISPDNLVSCFQIFPWEERVKFKIKTNCIKITIKNKSLDDFQAKISMLQRSRRYNWKPVDLDNIIQDEHEAFGVSCILSKFGPILPLVGTNRIYIDSKDENISLLIQNAIRSFNISKIPTDGLEIFTQEYFNDMSLFRKASLIQIPDSTWYSILHLYQNKPIDPHTRKEFTDEFKAKLNKEVRSITGPFMNGFPPTKFDPQLITKTSDPSHGYLNSFGSTSVISFYVQLAIPNMKDSLYFFWQIPDLRETKYASITMEALQILITKWSDGSIFNNEVNFADVYLIFSPKALYVFEKSSIEISSGLYPQDKHRQAENLQEQIRILRTI